MNKSQVFKLAHAFANKVKQKGDSYSACFALALKEIYATVAEFKSIEKVKASIAKNGSHYIEVLASEAEAMIGKTVKVFANLSHGAQVSPRRGRNQQASAKLNFSYTEITLEAKGSVFGRDNDTLVRIYGTASKIEKAI